MIYHKDNEYNFTYGFDPRSGMYMRSGVLDENGNDTGKDPFMASFPHLIDVGIMGSCAFGKSGLCQKAGIECYQSGPVKSAKNMSLEDFESICQQCEGKTNQFALGGRGDPDQHEHFEEILSMCRRYNIVPNFTTSGLGMNASIAAICKKYCGAVAVSQYSRLRHVIIEKPKEKAEENDENKEVYLESLHDLEGRYLTNGWHLCHGKCETEKYQYIDVYYETGKHTIKAIHELLKAGAKTNIHYVVGNQSIDELLLRLRINGFPKGINAVILLLHKPCGLGSQNNVLTASDEKVRQMYEMTNADYPFKIGMDTCNTPGLVNFCKTVDLDSIDACEGGRFSCYISSDMKMVPCSFDQEYKYVCDLHEMSIKQAWNSKEFEKFRSILGQSCSKCEMREQCMGGCPLMPEIALCKNRKEND